MIFKGKVFTACLVLMCLVGCDAIKRAQLIPQEKLTPRQEERIAKAIEAKDHSSLRAIGKLAVPALIEKILDLNSQFQYGMNYLSLNADAAHFIQDLGKIRDRRAMPALKYLLANKKNRTLRMAIALALADIRDKSANDLLWKVYKEELGYLEKGRAKGPDYYGWGLANNYTYLVLFEVGSTLKDLGENVGEIPMDKGTRMFQNVRNMR